MSQARAVDPNALMRAAEASFSAGRFQQSEQALAMLRKIAPGHPAMLHLSALVARRLGDSTRAGEHFRAALAASPHDPEILGNYANLLADTGLAEEALEHYAAALRHRPDFVAARVNRAALLQKLDRHDEALSELSALRRAGHRTPQILTMTGTSHLAKWELSEAAEEFEAALSTDPERVRAIVGRGTVALHRGEPDASRYFREALLRDPRNVTTQLQLAEALEAEGDPAALATMEAAVAADPRNPRSQQTLARMRWEAGAEGSFTDLLRAEVEKSGSADLWLTLAQVLATADQHRLAAEAARDGLAAVGAHAGLAYVHASELSEAGEVEAASAAFERFHRDGLVAPGANIGEIRHRLRTGEFALAREMVESLLRREPWSVQGWAYQSLLWRVSGDPREDWLHRQAGLVAQQSLGLSDAEVGGLAECLRGLHRTRAHPLGQSLRGGTQTRGRLLERMEPEVRRLRGAIEEAVGRFVGNLPPADEHHPLLRHRDRRLRLAGSWSVRLVEGGYHVAHIHTRGVLSSACYIAVPDGLRNGEGQLEVGAAPPELGLNLPALAAFDPRPGTMVLFPSTLFHGTRPFPAGERLTAAFDVVAS